MTCRCEILLAKSTLDALDHDCTDIEQKHQFEGALLWKEKRYADALKLFQDALTATGLATVCGDGTLTIMGGGVSGSGGMGGPSLGGGGGGAPVTSAGNSSNVAATLTYNIALCHFSMKNYGPALKSCTQIIEKGIREHPELSIGEGFNNRSVGNTNTLKNSCLIEAFNLRAAIEYIWT